MRYFINEDGKVEFCSTEHSTWAKLKGNTLAKVLKTTVRVRVHNRALVYETLQKELTDRQKRALNKLYREHCCFTCNGMINRKALPISELPKRIKFSREQPDGSTV